MLEHKIADLQTSIDAMASEKTELEAKLKSVHAPCENSASCNA